MPVRHYDWIAHFGRRTPEKLAVVDLASERRHSYAQFDARISRLAAHLRDRLGVDAQRMPLACVLEGGTWAAGRRIAAERRPGGMPPVNIVSDGTVF